MQLLALIVRTVSFVRRRATDWLCLAEGSLQQRAQLRKLAGLEMSAPELAALGHGQARWSSGRGERAARQLRRHYL